MSKEILQEIRDLKLLLEKIIGLDKETPDKKYSEESLNNAQKLYLKMSIERGTSWNPASFIRKEFEFTNWIKRGHEYLN